ncbi:MAG: stage II sporulation protein D [Clostridia bacterium]
MFRIFTLSLILVIIIYFLPVATGEQALEEISLPVFSDFSISELINVDEIIDFEKNEKIFALIDGVSTEIEIDEFLVGVVSAEMPASFEIEALKAQAVAARTYIYYKQWLIDNGLSDGVHENCVVCDDPSHCKSYVDITTQNPWGDSYEIYKSKIENAVYSTEGEYVTYQDEPIAAVFHSTSSASTESAVDVWGTDIPYLQAVSSQGSESSPNYKSSVKVSLEDFEQIILSKYSDVDLSVDKTDWFKNSTRSDSGGIITVYIGGVEVKGSDIRTLFSLNSTNFTIEFDDKYIIFNTTGYGHGVGLSQYGANSLAQDGKTYEQILSWYYSDTEIAKK